MASSRLPAMCTFWSYSANIYCSNGSNLGDLGHLVEGLRGRQWNPFFQSQVGQIVGCSSVLCLQVDITTKTSKASRIPSFGDNEYRAYIHLRFQNSDVCSEVLWYPGPTSPLKSTQLQPPTSVLSVFIPPNPNLIYSDVLSLTHTSSHQRPPRSPIPTQRTTHNSKQPSRTSPPHSSKTTIITDLTQLTTKPVITDLIKGAE
ncbi:uncharacterized protein CLUP02_17596 [Colletotrichum lupini]|uniref:Uncharacterized protein n=1 Tax=Colletotrichum lupini TaxID=145971 RepID=A0A9Q8WB38_9PEZI|nr:uncharacterized protein CLUP02_17596 [Colletotrichum lupini]UQC76085.1 hypothetical protein CLUP02_17596 [Colletotrichum lupini]